MNSENIVNLLLSGGDERVVFEGDNRFNKYHLNPLDHSNLFPGV